MPCITFFKIKLPYNQKFYFLGKYWSLEFCLKCTLFAPKFNFRSNLEMIIEDPVQMLLLILTLFFPMFSGASKGNIGKKRIK